MHLVNKTDDYLIFEFHAHGKGQLTSILNCFPLPSKWEVELSRNDSEGELEEDRAFLEETLGNERNILKTTLDGFLNSPATFYQEDEVDHMRLKLDKVEWILQVLNDIRISAWQLLGSPNEEEKAALEEFIQGDVPAEKMQQAQLFLLLELAGYYQAVIIESLSDEESEDSA